MDPFSDDIIPLADTMKKIEEDEKKKKIKIRKNSHKRLSLII